MMSEHKDFEIIDQYGCKQRYQGEVDGGRYYYWYEFGIASGTLDVIDRDVLHVYKGYRDEDDEFEIIATYPFPAKAGYVDPNTTLAPAVLKSAIEICPRCGYSSRYNRRPRL